MNLRMREYTHKSVSHVISDFFSKKSDNCKYLHKACYNLWLTVVIALFVTRFAKKGLIHVQFQDTLYHRLLAVCV